ncbi:MAG: Uncharacterised protein [Alphaproteobacteria bacterium]|nr:MAG: Uncharacterised protein [Alphaproteobacteria bacterium]
MGVRVKLAWSGGRFEEGSMYKSKLRLLGVSALVGAGLLAAGPAEAYNVRLGGVDIQIDTTASAGVSVRVADRDMGTGYVAEINGGPAGRGTVTQPTDGWGAANDDISVGCGGTEGNPNSVAHTYGVICAYDESPVTGYNYAGSQNTDNGRLNFDSGDIIGGTLKLTSDIEFSINNNLSAFVRINAFADPVLGDDGSYERAAEDEDKAATSGDIKVLDAYVDYDTQILGNPMLIRVGRQVINWGEATFSFGGNSVFNPLDVNAFIRPGSEIKEALIPNGAIYASLALPYDLTVEAYAALEHRGFQVPRPGTPFSSSDVTHQGKGGTKGQAWLGSNPYSGTKFNCDLGVVDGGTNASAVTRILAAAIDAEKGYSTDPQFCDGGKMDWRETNNDVERAARDEGYDRAADGEGDEGGDMGLAVRWYSEALNSTEFGLFYQKYDSRIPYAQWISNGPTLSFSNSGARASTTGRILAGSSFLAGTEGDYTACGGAPVNYGLTDVLVADPKELAPTMAALDYGGVPNAGTTITGELDFAEAMQIVCQAYMVRFGMATPGAIEGEVGAGYVDNGTVTGAGPAYALGNGELNPAIGQDVDLSLVYPEDVESIGVSFNTTLLGWGLQGEISHKPDFPLSMDSNDAFLGALIGSCIFEQFPVYGVSLNGFGKTLSADRGVSCSSERQVINSWFEEDITTWTLGTTATFTRSNPVTSLLGADLLVLLTEFNGVYFEAEGDHDQASEGSGLGASQVDITSASACTFGTDIAAGGTFSIDPVPVDHKDYIGCRATRDAYEGIVLVSAQYNNVFGTPVSVSPRFVHRRGLAGIAPRPAASYVEDVSSTNIGITAEYQGQWRAGLSYTTYGGSRLYTKNLDRDFVSIDLSYAF